MQRNKHTLAVIILTLIICLIPFSLEARNIEDVKTDMLKLLPDTSNLKEWKQSEQVRYYKAEPSDPALLNPILNDPKAAAIPSLWEYIDGAADSYYSYGFIMLLLNRYQSEKNPDTEITVEIYLMKDPLNAFGIYSIEKKGIDKFFDIAMEGYYIQDSLIFWHGPYYIKLSSYGIKEENGDTLKKIGLEISNKIKDNSPAPAAINRFPELPGSKINAVYVPSEMLGIGLMEDGFMTEVTYNEKVYRLFLKQFPSEGEASELFVKITSWLSKSGKKQDPPSDWDQNSISVFQDSMIDRTILMKKDTIIAGVAEFENIDEALKVAKIFFSNLE